MLHYLHIQESDLTTMNLRTEFCKLITYYPVDLTIGSSQQGRDCQGHGTHVAALAAGKTFGVAKNATLHSMRVLSCSGTGSFTNVILGLNHVVVIPF